MGPYRTDEESTGGQHQSTFIKVMEKQGLRVSDLVTSVSHTAMELVATDCANAQGKAKVKRIGERREELAGQFKRQPDPTTHEETAHDNPSPLWRPEPVQKPLLNAYASANA